MPCSSKLLEHALFHVIVGTDHESALPLLVYQICEISKKCVKNKNMLILLHAKYKNGTENQQLIDIKKFLEEQGIGHQMWYDINFTANSKMIASYDMLRSHEDPRQLIYQVDVDEFPQLSSFNTALNEIHQDKCDTIKAEWMDRVHGEGKLTSPQLINASSDLLGLEEQYPLRYEYTLLVVCVPYQCAYVNS